MMNIYFTVVFVAVFAFANGQLTPEQRGKLTQHLADCKASTNVQDADIGLLMQQEIPQSQEGKCFGACMLKKIKVMNDDNSVSIPRIEELMDLIKDEAKRAALLQIFNTCAAEVTPEPDECAVAEKLMKCVKREVDSSTIQASFVEIIA